MRLLRIDEQGWVTPVQFTSSKIPQYAILSHRWEQDEDQEVLLKDLTGDSVLAKAKKGCRKLELCIQKAQDDGLRYFWIDSSCIDRSSSAELSEAITSMYRWYQNAAKCYVYLADVARSSTLR